MVINNSLIIIFGRIGGMTTNITQLTYPISFSYIPSINCFIETLSNTAVTSDIYVHGHNRSVSGNKVYTSVPHSYSYIIIGF